MTLGAFARLTHWKFVLAAPFLASFALVSAPTPAFAQDDVSEARVRKMEAEIRALQRKVFPGGNERFFEPEIRAQEGGTEPARAASVSTTAVTDILARLDAIELQMQQLTARSEENSNALALLSQQVAELEARAALGGTAPMDADQGAAAGLPTLVDNPSENESEDSGANASNLAAMGATTVDASAGSATDAATGVAQLDGPTAERLAAVQAVAKPQTGDAADDEYSYGFRLWNAGFYPEARQQLTSFVETYPDHWRVSYGRNLLGRSFLDDGEPRKAAQWFYKNYQADKTAPRAPDSLLFLAESMIALDDTRRACSALAEFGESYPELATGRLMEKYRTNKAKVSCGAGAG